jgi:hypothetical protein
MRPALVAVMLKSMEACCQPHSWYTAALCCQVVYTMVMMRLERTGKPTSDSVLPASDVCWIGESVL